MSVDAYGELHTLPERSRRTRTHVRCAGCGRLLAEMVTAPWRIRCSRCKAENESAVEIDPRADRSSESDG